MTKNLPPCPNCGQVCNLVVKAHPRGSIELIKSPNGSDLVGAIDNNVNYKESRVARCENCYCIRRDLENVDGTIRLKM